MTTSTARTAFRFRASPGETEFSVTRHIASNLGYIFAPGLMTLELVVAGDGSLAKRTQWGSVSLMLNGFSRNQMPADFGCFLDHTSIALWIGIAAEWPIDVGVDDAQVSPLQRPRVLLRVHFFPSAIHVSVFPQANRVRHGSHGGYYNDPYRLAP